MVTQRRLTYVAVSNEAPSNFRRQERSYERDFKSLTFTARASVLFPNYIFVVTPCIVGVPEITPGRGNSIQNL